MKQLFFTFTVQFYIMKKLFIVFIGFLSLTACKDYDAQFDELNKELKALKDQNEAISNQLTQMQLYNAGVAQQTGAVLGQFSDAIEGIIDALESLGTVSGTTLALLQGVIEDMEAVTALVNENLENLATIEEELGEVLMEIQAQLIYINENVLHHSGGGAHHSGGGSVWYNEIPPIEYFTGQEGTDNGDDALDLHLSVPDGTTAVRLTGPWWSWDPNGGPVATENEDGTWTVTMDMPAANMEYLWVVDGVQENLIDNAAGGECAERIDEGLLITDYFSYANRKWFVDSGDQAETYDSCSIDTE